jgi:hypothetical protein
VAASRTPFIGLVDDAALFPPGNAAMPDALAEHARHRDGPYADLVGPFLCPTSRVPELLDRLPPTDRLDVSLILDGPPERLDGAVGDIRADERVTLRAVEAAQARLGDAAAEIGQDVRRLAPVVGYLEVPRSGYDEAMALVADDGWAAVKYRTGGTSADAFPSEAELAAFLVAAAAQGVTFKLTAGLHHAVRHTAGDTGFEHHGVLNVLVATSDALAGDAVDEVATTLSQRDASRLASRVLSWSEAESAAARGTFRSFGCCGVTEPIEDLRDLGLIEEAP